MLNDLMSVNLWVHDQDEALAFYTTKVGMEVRMDATMAEMGNFRYLTVSTKDQPDVQLILGVPGPPMHDAETVKLINELVGKGVMTGVSFRTSDCRGTYEELKKRGVEFTQEPSVVPWGMDAAFRDPSGNNIRIVQLSET
jgi:predicted enzyme related to lactoylglutathione lyase